MGSAYFDSFTVLVGSSLFRVKGFYLAKGVISRIQSFSIFIDKIKLNLGRLDIHNNFLLVANAASVNKRFNLSISFWLFIN